MKTTNVTSRLLTFLIHSLSRSLVLILIFGLAGPCFSQAWLVAWKDEFKREGLLDTVYWNYVEGNPEKVGAQFFMAGSVYNTRISNDHLFMQMRKNLNSEYPFSSAHIHTKNKINFRYGRVEVKAKMPKNSMIQPTIGLCSVNDHLTSISDYGEVQVCNQTLNSIGKITARVYTGDNKGKASHEKPFTVYNPNVDYHVYAFEWDENYMQVFIDDKLCYQYKRDSDAWPFEQPLYLFIDMKIDEQATHSQAINENFYQLMVIDYVRYYKKLAPGLSTQG